MNFLNNPWVIGIIGGIISGIVVFFITNIIVNKINKKDYYKTVAEINLKVSKMLIMSISEGKIPSHSVVDSLLSSLAKRNKVQKKDINSIGETYDDLITELYETNFIPIDKKQTLAENLIEVKNSSITNNVDSEITKESSMKEIDSDFVYLNQRRKLLTQLATFLMIVPTYFFFINIFLKDTLFFDILFNSDNILMIFVIMTITFTLVITMLTSLSINKKKSEIKKRREELYAKFKELD